MGATRRGRHQMFGSLGLPEILFILFIALLVFGPRRLPEIGRTVGRALGEFRRATHDLKRSLDTEVALEETRQGPSSTATPAPGSEPEAGGAAVDSGKAEPDPRAD